MKNVIEISRLSAAMMCCWPLMACTSASDTSLGASPPTTPPMQQQRSYLDVGPSASPTGGPNYVRANRTSATRQTDFFGNAVLP